MAKKENTSKSLQKGLKGKYSWELTQSLKDKNEYTLSISEVQEIEKEVITKELREVPKETSTKIPATDQNGKVLKDAKGKGVMETLIKKTVVIEEVKVSNTVRVPKLDLKKKFTFYFRPYHFQLQKTVKNCINALDSK